MNDLWQGKSQLVYFVSIPTEDVFMNFLNQHLDQSIGMHSYYAIYRHLEKLAGLHSSHATLVSRADLFDRLDLMSYWSSSQFSSTIQEWGKSCTQDWGKWWPCHPCWSTYKAASPSHAISQRLEQFAGLYPSHATLVSRADLFDCIDLTLHWSSSQFSPTIQKWGKSCPQD